MLQGIFGINISCRDQSTKKASDEQCRGASMELGGASGASQEKASAADWRRLEWSSRRLGPEVEGALGRLKAP